MIFNSLFLQYKCECCDYESSDTYKLKRHMRVHTKAKPYECDVCLLRFTQSNSLKVKQKFFLFQFAKWDFKKLIFFFKYIKAYVKFTFFENIYLFMIFLGT